MWFGSCADVRIEATVKRAAGWDRSVNICDCSAQPGQDDHLPRHRSTHGPPLSVQAGQSTDRPARQRSVYSDHHPRSAAWAHIFLFAVSGKCRVKFGHFVNFSGTYFQAKMSSSPKVDSSYAYEAYQDALPDGATTMVKVLKSMWWNTTFPPLSFPSLTFLPFRPLLPLRSGPLKSS